MCAHSLIVRLTINASPKTRLHSIQKTRLYMRGSTHIALTLYIALHARLLDGWFHTINVEKEVLPVTLVCPARFDNCFKDCVDSMLESVFDGSAFPDETIVVVSDYNHTMHSDQVNHLVAAWSRRLPRFQLRRRHGRHVQASNRNFGAALANPRNLLTFFDVDDIMHPQRIEIMYHLFQMIPSLQYLQHRFVEFKSHNAILPFGMYNTSSISLTHNYSVIHAAYSKNVAKFCCVNVDGTCYHNAWPTMRYSVFQANHGFDTSEHLFRSEDSEFFNRLASLKYNCSVISAVLGFYNQLQPRACTVLKGTPTTATFKRSMP